jgi:hypothetical protein
MYASAESAAPIAAPANMPGEDTAKVYVIEGCHAIAERYSG